MSVYLAGCGAVTPLGTDLGEVWKRLRRGDLAEIRPLRNPENGAILPYIPVPLKTVEALACHPRLRRSSAISYFAVAAGLAALADAGLELNPTLAAHTAVVFAISSGGVIYTRKFYEQIVKQGASAASPLLFPETVYNAPASHLAAQLGIDGPSYTLVGDASVGLAALGFAEQLLATDQQLRQVVVVGSEEVDWVLAKAYADWRLARRDFDSTRGAVLAEGAAAVVLARTGKIAIPQIHGGLVSLRQSKSAEILAQVFCELQNTSPSPVCDLVVSCANGSFIDRAERQALAACGISAPLFAPKRALGEALGASALGQIVLGATALQRGEFPEENPATFKANPTRVLISCLGWNHQASAAILAVA